MVILAGLREVQAFLRASLLNVTWEPTPDHGAALVRRWLVVGVSLALGAAALGGALMVTPGDPLFYAATLGVAAIWVVGALASGPIKLGRGRARAGHESLGVLQGFILGGMLLTSFLAGALVVARIPPLLGPVNDLLDHARFGSLWVVAVITAATGAAEELFFRGAIFSAIPGRWAIAASTALYATSTLLSGVLLLTFAAICLGLLTAAQRRVTGGVLGPITSHLTWSLGMLFLLPHVLTLGV